MLLSDHMLLSVSVGEIPYLIQFEDIYATHFNGSLIEDLIMSFVILWDGTFLKTYTALRENEFEGYLFNKQM